MHDLRPVLLSCCLTTALATTAGAVAPTISDLDWLAGCWRDLDGEPGSGEQWSDPAGGTMLGAGRTVRGGKTVSHEFVMIRETGDGALEYVAHPSGQPSAAFRLEDSGPRRLVFADPEHDFPQRITYELRTDGILAARIEGTVGGEERSADFPMERVTCPGGPGDGAE